MEGKIEKKYPAGFRLTTTEIKGRRFKQMFFFVTVEEKKFVNNQLSLNLHCESQRPTCTCSASRAVTRR